MLDLIQKLLAMAIADPAFAGLLVGALTPPIVAVLQRPNLSNRARTAIALVSALVLGAGTAWSSGQLDTGSLLTILLTVYVTSEATYQKLWSQVGLTNTIELATTPKRLRPEAQQL